jgi:protein-tyrosine phosphatase
VDPELTSRLVPLEGGINFRDLGGYATTAGRTVKWRHVYRSGMMARLTPADKAELTARGIRAVVDFRTTVEQQADPSHWVHENGLTFWSRDHDETFGNIHQMAEKGIATEAEAHQVMIEGFRFLPFQQAEAYAAMFRLIAAGEVPLVFNCTAGKDRTGGAAVLVLAALGVPRETIAADFHMTERAVDLRKAFAHRAHPDSHKYTGLDPRAGAVIGRAHPDWAMALLDAVEEKCGSVEGYLAELGLNGGDVRAVREALLD